MSSRLGKGLALVSALVAASGWVVVVCPGRASAQQDEQERARGAFQRGVELFGDGDYEGALESFQEAYRLRPHPAVRVNMANCYERLGRPVEALFHYERFLSEADPQLLQGRQVEVRRAIAALERQVGQLALMVTPAAARVRLDGEVVQVGEAPIRLIAGDHRIEVSAEGYRSHSESFRAVAGERTSITVELRRGAGGGSTAVSVSGARRTPGPASRRREGQAPRTGASGGRVAAAATAPPTTEPGPEPEPDTGGGSGGGFGARLLSTPVLISGGAAIALFVGGTVTGVLALGAESDFDAAATQIERHEYTSDEQLRRLQAQGQDDADSASTLALVSDVMMVSALVAGGFAVYFIISYSEDDGGSQRASARVQAVPVVGADSAGLVLRGAF